MDECTVIPGLCFCHTSVVSTLRKWEEPKIRNSKCVLVGYLIDIHVDTTVEEPAFHPLYKKNKTTKTLKLKIYLLRNKDFSIASTSTLYEVGSVQNEIGVLLVCLNHVWELT